MLSSGWILTLLFPTLVLQFTAVAQQSRAFFTVKVGDGVTLPCEIVKQEKHNCDRITWTSNQPGNRNVSWFNRGSFTEEAKAKSDRMSVTPNCSLVIKNVTADDFGEYICREDRNPVFIMVVLTVTTMTEQRNNETVTFNCSVTKYTVCKHTVVWVFEGKVELPSEKNVSASCSAAITIPTSHLQQNWKFYELLKCKVINTSDRKYLFFTFSRQHSGEKTGNNTSRVLMKTTESTFTEESATARAVKSAATESTVTKPNNVESLFSTSHMWTSVTPTTTQFSKDNQTKPQGWFWWAVIVSVLMAGLLITMIVIITLKKTKGAGDESQLEETSQVDPKNVSYASISFSKRKSKLIAPVPSSVTYSTLNAFSPAKGP